MLTYDLNVSKFRNVTNYLKKKLKTKKPMYLRNGDEHATDASDDNDDFCK